MSGQRLLGAVAALYSNGEQDEKKSVRVTQTGQKAVFGWEIEKAEQNDKPGSVVNDHLSSFAVAGKVERPT